MFAQGMTTSTKLSIELSEYWPVPAVRLVSLTPRSRLIAVCRLNLLLNVWVRPGWLRPCIPDRIVNYLSARKSLANLSGEIGDVVFPNGWRHDLTGGGIDRGDYRAFGIRRLHLQIDVVQPNTYYPAPSICARALI